MNPTMVLAVIAVAGATILAVVLLSGRHRHNNGDSRTGRRGDTAIRVTAGLTTVGLAGIAGAISYQHLLILAETHGQRGWLGHAFPLSVDGVEIVASLRLLADRRTNQRSGWLPWAALAVGTVFSLFANVAVAEPDLTARVIAGWPAVALMIAIKLLAGLLDQQQASANPAQEAAPPEEPEPGRDASPTPPTTRDSGTTPDPSVRPRRGRRRERQLLPVDLMRRIPVNTDAYLRWRNLWTDLRSENADQNALAQQHQVSVRHLQFVRAAGEAGLLDSTVPPAHRVAELTGNTDNGNEPATAPPKPDLVITDQ